MRDPSIPLSAGPDGARPAPDAASNIDPGPDGGRSTPVPADAPQWIAGEPAFPIDRGREAGAARLRALADAASGAADAATPAGLAAVLRRACAAAELVCDGFRFATFHPAANALRYHAAFPALAAGEEETGWRALRECRTRLTAGRPGTSSILSTPVAAAGETLGVLVVTRRAGRYDAGDVELAEALAAVAAPALARMRMADALAASAGLERRVDERTRELAEANDALAAEVHRHRAARDELQQRTAELEGIFRALPDLYFRLADDGRILDYRAGAHNGLYVDPGAFLGRRLQEVMPPEVGRAFDAACAEVLATGHAAPMEYALRGLDGVERAYEARLVRLMPGELAAVVRDITERAQAQDALRRSEAHFRRLIENAQDMIALVDPAGAMTFVSGSALRILGHPPESLEGRSAFEFIHHDDASLVAAELERSFATPGYTGHVEYRFRHRDGGWRWLEAFGQTLVPGAPEDGIVANIRDVTERRLAEEALRGATAEAEAANRAKSEFLSRMSHELRTPMNSILGFAQLLERAPLAAEQRRGVQHVLTAGRHLLRLINEVLDIARIESGRQQLSLEAVRLDAAVDEALALTRPLAAQHGVSLGREDADGDLFVRADRQRLVQVLLNLLSNAVKYNRPGGAVRVSWEMDEDAGVRLRVRDTGAGIAPEAVAQLFVPFARLGAEQGGVEGTGLGLALSRRLVQAMGGEMELESTSADGSVFAVRLRGADDPLDALALRPAGPGADAPAVPVTLLYVEDNLANLSLVETILSARPGWRTIPALQGRLGTELAREHEPDLVLLDLHLPDLQGDEVLRRLRADERTARIPVVMISADATPRTIDRLRAQGADAYLTKPLDVDEFLSTLDRLLPAPAGP